MAPLVQAPSERNEIGISELSVRLAMPKATDEKREPQLVAMLRNASRDISRQLGCTAFPLDPPAPARR